MATNPKKKLDLAVRKLDNLLGEYNDILGQHKDMDEALDAMPSRQRLALAKRMDASAEAADLVIAEARRALSMMSPDGRRAAEETIADAREKVEKARRNADVLRAKPPQPRDEGAADIVGAVDRVAAATEEGTNRVATPGETLAGTITMAAERVRSAPGLASAGRHMRRTELQNTEAAPLWQAIVVHTEAIGFRSYQTFINNLLCPDPSRTNTASGIGELYNLRPGLDPYRLLRLATEAFLLRQSGVWRDPGGNGTGRVQRLLDPPSELDVRHLFPNRIDRQVGEEVPASLAEFRARLTAFLGDSDRVYLNVIVPELLGEPIVPGSRDDDGGGVASATWPGCAMAAPLGLPSLLELIWSYWHEEGMLSQTANAIGARFQNVRSGRTPDPLAELELDPIRPLNTIIWGWVNDESNRLSVLRRAYEYNHHYGLALYGRATRRLRPADPRSKFLESFHNLLRLTTIFYSQDDDTQFVSDAFPVLNALKELHLILAEGAHNQFRDLPWTARAEMLIEQWMLARPEMRDFLRGRHMVPYPEPWMGAVDSMKRLQGWTDTGVTHFRDLAVFGERLLLSIRHFLWVNVHDQEEARTWARYWRPEIQGYIHAYRAVTGVDLGNPDRVDAMIPAVHLRRRLVQQRQQQRVGPAAAARIQASQEALWVTQQETFPLLPQRVLEP